jgi:hypothetical protein
VVAAVVSEGVREALWTYYDPVADAFVLTGRLTSAGLYTILVSYDLPRIVIIWEDRSVRNLETSSFRTDRFPLHDYEGGCKMLRRLA